MDILEREYEFEIEMDFVPNSVDVSISDIFEQMSKEERSEAVDSLIEEYGEDFESQIEGLCVSLADELKFEHFKSIFNQYSLEEMQSLLPEKY